MAGLRRGMSYQRWRMKPMPFSFARCSQDHGERAAGRARLYADSPASTLCDRLDDREPEPGAAAVSLRGEKALEEMLAICVGDARALVADIDTQSAALSCKPHGHGFALAV